MVASNLAFGLLSPSLWLASFTVATVIGTRQVSRAFSRELPPLSIGDYPGPTWQLVAGAMFLLALALFTSGLFGASMTLSGRFVIAWLAMFCLRNCPWRFLRFLDVARDQQILELRGLAYSFRHPLIRDLVAEGEDRHSTCPRRTPLS